MSIEVNVEELTRVGCIVKAKVTITFDSDVLIGYSGNASDEVLKGYVKDAAIEQLRCEVQGYEEIDARGF